MPQWGKDEERCSCPTCERGPGPFDLPCEFKGTPVFIENDIGGVLRFKKNSRPERDWPLGPQFGYSKWELDYPYRCWEINWPKRAISGLKQALLGLQDFEYAEWMASHPGCH